MIKLKNILTEVAADRSWNSQLWNSDLWQSNLWNSDIWKSHIWNTDLWKSDLWKSDIWNPSSTTTAATSKELTEIEQHKPNEVEALPGIFVDPSIIKHIQILNKLGFHTVFSCSGISYDHPNLKAGSRSGYVMFRHGLTPNQITRIYKATLGIKGVNYDPIHLRSVPYVSFRGSDSERLNGWNQFVKNLMKRRVYYKKLGKIKESEEKHSRKGKCYELTGRYVSTHPDSILVHGKLVNPFVKGLPEIEHAWVEIGDKIFDPIMDITWPKQAYESLFHAKPYKKYTQEEVLKITLRTEHWGPWDV